MDANRDEAARCMELAAAALAAGEAPRAERLLAKAERMFEGELPGSRALLTKLRAQKKTGSSASTMGDSGENADRDVTDEMRAAVAAVSSARGYYAVLGVEQSADASALKRAYRRKVLALHPDKNVAAGAEEAFKRVGRAFEVLSDTRRRTTYDATGVDPDDSAPVQRRRRTHAHPHGHFATHQTFTGSDADELFELIFGRERMRRREYAYRRAQAREREDADTQSSARDATFAVIWVFVMLFCLSLISAIS